MKNIILLCSFIVIMFLCTSCQYKNPAPWHQKILTANWRHELKPKLCKCDDEKLVFIDEFIKNYPDLDSAFFETECYSIDDATKQLIKIKKSNKSRTKCIELLKDGYEIIANYKHVYIERGEKYIVHGISVIPTDDRGVISKATYDYPFDDRSYSLNFDWRYDKEEDKWILYGLHGYIRDYSF